MGGTTIAGTNAPNTPRVSVSASSFSWPVSKSDEGGDDSSESPSAEAKSKDDAKAKSAGVIDTT